MSAITSHFNATFSAQHHEIQVACFPIFELSSLAIQYPCELASRELFIVLNFDLSSSIVK